VTPTIEADAPPFVAAPTGKHHGSADTLIIATLNSTWQTTAEIFAAIEDRITVGRPNIHGRLKALAKRGVIEQKADAYAWRTKASKAPTASGKLAKVVASIIIDGALTAEQVRDRVVNYGLVADQATVQAALDMLVRSNLATVIHGDQPTYARS